MKKMFKLIIYTLETFANWIGRGIEWIIDKADWLFGKIK